MKTPAIASAISALALTCCVVKTGCAQKDLSVYDKGVVINGVKWATRNVDAYRTFAPTPESPGQLYQWNRKKAWQANVKRIENWDNTMPRGTEWEKANDPCPDGWRLPDLKELKLLFNSDNSWTEINNVKGRKFGNGDNTIFLPAAGEISGNDKFSGMSVDKGTLGYYWSRSGYNSTRAHLLLFFYGNVDTGGVGGDKRSGQSVRCVAE